MTIIFYFLLLVLMSLAPLGIQLDRTRISSFKLQTPGCLVYFPSKGWKPYTYTPLEKRRAGCSQRRAPNNVSVGPSSGGLEVSAAGTLAPYLLSLSYHHHLELFSEAYFIS
jgi:hypothetical protein